MAEGQTNFIIKKGATWPKTIIYTDSEGTPVPLTNYTVVMDIKERLDSTSPILQLSIGSGITVTPAEGKIEIKITDAQTSAITITEGVYDLKITDPSSPGESTYLLEGSIVFKPSVS